MDHGHHDGNTLNQLSLSKRFQLKALELAQQGTLGSLRTRKPSLQSAYALMVSLLDSPHIPFLVYGENGAGKRKHIDEYLVLHNFFCRLEFDESGVLRVLRGDFLGKGFARQLFTPHSKSSDLVYIDRLDLLDLELQDELIQALEMRKKLSQAGARIPRLIVGTDQALSLRVVRGDFRRELFQALTSVAVFLPSLCERSDDLPHIVQSLIGEITGREQSPPAWLLDAVGAYDWPGNITELRQMLQRTASFKADVDSWKIEDLPVTLRRGVQEFEPAKLKDLSRESKERDQIKSLLLKSGGNRDLASRELGMSRAQFLSKLVSLGLR